MAGSVNKVILIGNLGAKPELKYLPSGQAVCEMRLATNEMLQRQEPADARSAPSGTAWSVWGKTGENCAQYLDKGRQVYSKVGCRPARGTTRPPARSAT